MTGSLVDGAIVARAPRAKVGVKTRDEKKRHRLPDAAGKNRHCGGQGGSLNRHKHHIKFRTGESVINRILE
jgi:hypothetical protein